MPSASEKAPPSDFSSDCKVAPSTGGPPPGVGAPPFRTSRSHRCRGRRGYPEPRTSVSDNSCRRPPPDDRNAVRRRLFGPHPAGAVIAAHLLHAAGLDLFDDRVELRLALIENARYN